MMAIATIITATLRAVATMASLMMKEEKVPFCFTRYLRAMKNDKFNRDRDSLDFDDYLDLYNQYLFICSIRFYRFFFAPF